MYFWCFKHPSALYLIQQSWCILWDTVWPCDLSSPRSSLLSGCSCAGGTVSACQGASHWVQVPLMCFYVKPMCTRNEGFIIHWLLCKRIFTNILFRPLIQIWCCKAVMSQSGESTAHLVSLNHICTPGHCQTHFRVASLTDKNCEISLSYAPTFTFVFFLVLWGVAKESYLNRNYLMSDLSKDTMIFY